MMKHRSLIHRQMSFRSVKKKVDFFPPVAAANLQHMLDENPDSVVSIAEDASTTSEAFCDRGITYGKKIFFEPPRHPYGAPVEGRSYSAPACGDICI